MRLEGDCPYLMRLSVNHPHQQAEGGGREGIAQALQGDAHLCLYGLYRQSEFVGYLLVGQLLVAAQHEYFPALGRQLVDSPVHHGRKLLQIEALSPFSFQQLLVQPPFQQLVAVFFVAQVVEHFVVWKR